MLFLLKHSTSVGEFAAGACAYSDLHFKNNVQIVHCVHFALNSLTFPHQTHSYVLVH